MSNTNGESYKGLDLNVVDGSLTIPMRRKEGVTIAPGVELDSVTIRLEGVELQEGQSGYEYALEAARKSCPHHEPCYDFVLRNR